jgi:hypothetical protein
MSPSRPRHPETKPNPADPLSNPSALPDHSDCDLPLPGGDEMPEPEADLTPSPPLRPDPHHPLGPRDIVERS